VETEGKGQKIPLEGGGFIHSGALHYIIPLFPPFSLKTQKYSSNLVSENLMFSYKELF
jgi:hypothetical protein